MNSSPNAPRRCCVPVQELFIRRVRVLVGVAGGAPVRNLVLACHRRRDELKLCDRDERVGHALRFYLRHVAGDAVATRAYRLVVCVLFQARGVRAIRRVRPMTTEAQFLCQLAQVRVVAGAVDIMAGGAGYAVAIYHALHKIITLHSVLVRSRVSKVDESGLPESNVLQFSIVCETETNVITDRPVIGFTLNQIAPRLPLRVALNARIVGGHVIHRRRIKNIGARGMSDVLASWSVATLAAHVPLGNLLGVDVVVH